MGIGLLFKYIGLGILAWTVFFALMFWMWAVLFDCMPGDMIMAL